MTPITFYFDPISPYSYLAFERLPQVLAGRSYVVEYRPVLFAGLLKHWGQLGPAEVPPKRDWTFRQIAWQAHHHGVPLQMPTAHPFNPLPLLRLLIATAADGQPSRFACEAVFRHVWRGAADPTDAQRLESLTRLLQPVRDPKGDDVKQQLRDNTEAAVARGVFGVPTMELPDGKQFWGHDSLDMLAACLGGDVWFDHRWNEAGAPVPGVQRPPKR